MTETNNDALDTKSTIKTLEIQKEHLLQRHSEIKFRWIFAAILGLFIVTTFTTLIFHVEKENAATSLSELLLVSLVGGIFIAVGPITGYWYLIVQYKRSMLEEIRLIEYKLVQISTNILQENIEDDFFTKLVQINLKNLEQYYIQTQQQADKSFRLASLAAWIGLMIITIGITMMLLGRFEPAYMTTSLGLISEFISAIFFYLYNRTIIKMSQYHHKLVLSQNINIALKVSSEMNPEEKTKTQKLIISRLTKDINQYLTAPEKK